MSDLHGLILADRKAPGLHELVDVRTSASLPFCGRYRLIDFALSSMRNAGVRDVGVIMQRDYQSLLDHLGSGKDWDMSRRGGGLRLLPPFGQPKDTAGDHSTIIDALWAVESYIRGIKNSSVVLCRGDLAANIDLAAAMERHLSADADVTAVCAPASSRADAGAENRFTVDSEGVVKGIKCRCGGGEGLASLEMFILKKQALTDIMNRCSDCRSPGFHKDGLGGLIENGAKIVVYEHKNYARRITCIAEYYDASMDMLDSKLRSELFPVGRPVRTKGRADVSTYYGEAAHSENSLVADGCYIEGSVENCVLFRRVRVGAGAVLKNCVIMQDSEVGAGAGLSYVITDKKCVISPGKTLAGAPGIPLVLPKKSRV